MNVKVKAGLDIVAFIVGAAAISGLVQFVLHTVETETILKVMGAVFVGYMLYLMWSIRVSQLQYRETLKEMVDKR